MVVLWQVQASQMRSLAGTNCNQVDSSGNCISCYYRWVLINGNCIAVSDQCKTWNSTTGACLSCYDGWNLYNGACTTIPAPTPDPNCSKFDASGNCIECKYGYIMINNKCVAIIHQCATWDTTTGVCTSCF